MVLFRLCSLWLISTLTHTHDRHRLDWSTLFFIWFKKPTKWKLKVSCLFHFTCLRHQTQADKTTWISWLVYVYMYIYSINIWLYIWILMHMNYNSYLMMPELSLIQVIITFYSYATFLNIYILCYWHRASMPYAPSILIVLQNDKIKINLLGNNTDKR